MWPQVRSQRQSITLSCFGSRWSAPADPMGRLTTRKASVAFLGVHLVHNSMSELPTNQQTRR